MREDYYEILGIPKIANEQEIKRAYRKLAHEHHPDKAGGDSGKFKELNHAYEVLSDPKKREQYNLYLSKINKVKEVEGIQSKVDSYSPKSQASNGSKRRDTVRHIWKYIGKMLFWVIILFIFGFFYVSQNEENPPSWLVKASDVMAMVIGIIVISILICGLLVHLYYTKFSQQLIKFVKKNIIGEPEEESCQCDDCVKQKNKK